MILITSLSQNKEHFLFHHLSNRISIWYFKMLKQVECGLTHISEQKLNNYMMNTIWLFKKKGKEEVLRRTTNDESEKAKEASDDQLTTKRQTLRIVVVEEPPFVS
jgi:hypothetical protein